MKEFEEVIGIQYLRALHLNDSKTPRGSKRDLHANIGTGFLGLRGFHNIMNEPRFQDLPMVLETPIDKPASSVTAGASGSTNAHEDGCASEMDSDSGSEPDSKKKTKKKPKRPTAKTKQPTVADPSVWAQEIELLEALIGMDPESQEFRSLEARLAEEGKEMREKHQEQFDRRMEAEEKKKSKGSGAGAGKKGQKSLMDMMKGKEN